MPVAITLTRPTFTDTDSLPAVTFNGVAVSSAQVPTGTDGSSVCIGNDARLSDSRQCNNSFDDPDVARPALLGTDKTVQFGNVKANPDTVAYAASVALDFDARDTQSITLAGNLTISGINNKAAGKGKRLRIIGDGSSRSLAFSEAWKWLNIAAAPTTLPANKTGELILFSYGTTAADIVAYWSVQA